MKRVSSVATVPVSERALLQRINRKLAHDDEKVVKARGRAVFDCGRFYTIDWRRGFLLHKDIDLEAQGRELGVLAKWEKLVEDD